MMNLFHFLHLLSAVTWAGGTLFFGLVLMPAMARRPAAEAQALYEGIGRSSGLLMGISGVLVLVTGPLRAVFGGGLTQWSDIWTPYGLMVISAFVIAFVASGVDGASRGRMRRAFEDPATYPEVAGVAARRNAWVSGGAMVALILIMGALGLGMY